MLLTINKACQSDSLSVTDLENRVGTLEDQSQKDGGSIATLEDKFKALSTSNEVLFGRLIKAEAKLEKQVR